MAFDVGAISQWNNEVADKSEIIMAPLLAASSMQYLKKYKDITGENMKLPKFETTTPWQPTASCGFQSSGTTTISQFTMTSAPVTINEAICLKDLAKYFTKEWLPKGTSIYTDVDIVDLWVSRKQANVAKQIESALWQSKTSYTNATHLKAFNGLISVLDTAADFVTATAQASITAANVVGIFRDIIFTRLAAIPETLGLSPQVFCSIEDYMILMDALITLNQFHYNPNLVLGKGELKMTYPGTNVEIIAVPGLNSTNSVDSGVLPVAVKHRIIATFKENLCVGFNAEGDFAEAKVWYSDDNDQLRMKLQFYLGVGIKFTNLCVVYANS